jgi:putative proteasome-type protease
MTYCVGILLDRGLVMASDTRTNAGMDNVGRFKKLHSWVKEGAGVFVLLTAGNLAVTQSVVSLLTEWTHARKGSVNARDNLFAAKTMFQAARIVGRAIREVKRIDGEQLGASSESFSADFIFGGQINGERVRLFHIYGEGNFIEATPDTPFFQIGEHKYGKPILDRVARADMRLGAAAKMVLLSFDSTLRSNLSVGMPIDLLLYESGSLRIERTRRIEQDDPYFSKLSTAWSTALRTAFAEIETFDI